MISHSGTGRFVDLGEPDYRQNCQSDNDVAGHGTPQWGEPDGEQEGMSPRDSFDTVYGVLIALGLSGCFWVLIAVLLWI